MQPDVSIILPFYNAQDFVATVIEGVREAFSGGDYSFEIIAVQNGSRDRTGENLADLRLRCRELRIVTLDRHVGFGESVLRGLEVASGKAVGWMSGDGQTPPEALPRLLKQMNRTCSDMGYGRRRTLPDRLSRLVGKLFGFETADVNGKPKLLTRRIYQSMKLRSPGSFIDAEALLKADRMGATICHIDVFPEGGEVEALGASQWLEFALNLCRARYQVNDPWGLNATPRNILSPLAMRRSAAR